MFGHEGVRVFVWESGVEPGHHIVCVRKTAEWPQDNHVGEIRSPALAAQRVSKVGRARSANVVPAPGAWPPVRLLHRICDLEQVIHDVLA